MVLKLKLACLLSLITVSCGQGLAIAAPQDCITEIDSRDTKLVVDRIMSISNQNELIASSEQQVDSLGFTVLIVIAIEMVKSCPLPITGVTRMSLIWLYRLNGHFLIYSLCMKSRKPEQTSRARDIRLRRICKQIVCPVDWLSCTIYIRKRICKIFSPW